MLYSIVKAKGWLGLLELGAVCKYLSWRAPLEVSIRAMRVLNQGAPLLGLFALGSLKRGAAAESGTGVGGCSRSPGAGLGRERPQWGDCPHLAPAKPPRPGRAVCVQYHGELSCL